MAHPLVLALFDDPSGAAEGARALRKLGVARERVSIVAKSHEEEGSLAKASDASPGSELEDSRPASRLAELSAHFLASVALGLPGVGPIVADGPLAARLGEMAGHLAGDIGRTLESAGLDREEAERWESDISEGAVLVGAHVDEEHAPAARDTLARSGASKLALGTWRD